MPLEEARQLPTPPEQSLAARVVRQEQARRIRQAVEAPPRGLRAVAARRLFEEETHAEIADALEITEATAQRQWSRTHERLPRRLTTSDK